MVINIISKVKVLSSILLEYSCVETKRENIDKDNIEFEESQKSRCVYALNCSFIMMGPNYFESYHGFDEFTYLYYEEHILAEMLLLESLDNLFVPAKIVLHKGASSTNEDWKGRARYMAMKFLRESFNYWYHNYYNKYNYSKD